MPSTRKFGIIPSRMSQPEQNTEEERLRGPVPPYIPFGTLRNLLRRMKQEGQPDLVDRSYLSGMSGGYQSQVIAALKSFGLIDGGGGPSQELELVLKADEEEWPSRLRDKTAAIYAGPLALAERNATQGQLENAFREEYEFSGSTLRKAIKFYLDVSDFVDLPVSPLWRAPSRPPRARKTARKATARRRRRVPSARTGQRAGAEDEGAVSSQATTQTVELASGGKVALGVAVDLFTLSEEDREFVFDLVDRMRSYSRSAQKPGSGQTEVSRRS
jgi:hypothetical protein